MIREHVVTSYLNQLQAALGDDKAFMPVFERLRLDPEVEQLEAVEIASRFVARTSPGTGRSKALERVMKRHLSLSAFKLKQRAMGGRSAA